MKIIGHRGAAGLALENTLPSLEIARLLGVDAIEFDVRMTKDQELVLCHDNDLSRISKSDAKVSELTLRDLQSITLQDDQSVVPTLKQALKMVGDIPVIIEIKQTGCAEELVKLLQSFHGLNISVASFKLSELATLRRLRPDLQLYGLENTKPFDIIQFARELKLSGIGLNFWLLNPLTYWLIKRSNLKLFVFTVNSRVIGGFIKWLYPQVAICTDRPEWFISHPWLRVRSNRNGSISKRSRKSTGKQSVIKKARSKHGRSHRG